MCCRIAMLAVVGWLAVEFGLRLPGSKYVGLDPVSAHDAMVSHSCFALTGVLLNSFIR